MGIEYPYFHSLDLPRVTHPLLRSAGEKVRWAEIHLEALQRNIWEYFNTPSNRPTLRADLDPQSGYHVFRVKHLPDYEGFNNNISLGIGDVISNVRASLDHVIWNIVVPRATTDPAFDARAQRLVAFPIADDNVALNRGRAWGIIEPHLTPAEQGIIRLALLDQPYLGAEGIQPRSRWGRWNSGNDHPLAILQTLSNDNKHRLLTTVLLLPTSLSFPNLGRVAMRQEEIGESDVVGQLLAVNVGGNKSNIAGETVEIPDTQSAPFGTPLALNAEVYWTRFADAVEPHIDNAGEIAPLVAFNDKSGVVQTLDRVTCFVKFLLGEFERVLPPPV